MQLLKITTTPVEYEMRVENARLAPKEPIRMPSHQVQHQPTELQMQSTDIKVKIDTFEARSSVGRKSAATQNKEAAQEGMRAASEATAQYAEMGNQMAKIYEGANIPDILYQKMFSQPMTQQVFIPSVPPEISWDPGSLNVQYSPGKLNFDWQTMRNQMEYIPGKFSMEIKQYPAVHIEYVGEPIYAPPSSNPNYQG